MIMHFTLQINHSEDYAQAVNNAASTDMSNISPISSNLDRVTVQLRMMTRTPVLM